MFNRWIAALLGATVVGIAVVLIAKGCTEPTAVQEADRPSEPGRSPQVVLRQFERDIGLQRWDFGAKRMTVVIAVVPRCNYGDWDAIKLDVENSLAPRLRLSLEPLGSAAASAQSVELTFADLEKGFSYSFDVGALRPGQAGLYLCMDSAGTGKCSDKKAQDINEIFASYAVPANQRLGVRPPDRQFYFQYLFFEQSELVTFSKPTLDPKEALNFGRWVSSHYPEGTDLMAVQQSIDKARAQSDAVTSVRVIRPKRGGDVQITLPRFDASRCNEPEKESWPE